MPKLTLNCENCKEVFYRYKVNNRPQKFCSRECFLHSDHHKEIQSRKMIQRNLIGSRNPRWKGDSVGYKSLHCFIENNYGVAKGYECFFCHGNFCMNWANISGQYKRDRSDWMTLCKPCHAEYDWSKKRMDQQVWENHYRVKIEAAKMIKEKLELLNI